MLCNRPSAELHHPLFSFLSARDERGEPRAAEAPRRAGAPPAEAQAPSRAGAPLAEAEAPGPEAGNAAK